MVLQLHPRYPSLRALSGNNRTTSASDAPESLRAAWMARSEPIPTESIHLFRDVPDAWRNGQTLLQSGIRSFHSDGTFDTTLSYGAQREAAAGDGTGATRP